MKNRVALAETLLRADGDAASGLDAEGGRMSRGAVIPPSRMTARQMEMVAYLAKAWRESTFDEVLEDAAIIFRAAVEIAKTKEVRE